MTQALNPDLALSINCSSTIDQSFNECLHDPASKACTAKGIKCSQAGRSSEKANRSTRHPGMDWSVRIWISTSLSIFSLLSHNLLNNSKIPKYYIFSSHSCICCLEKQAVLPCQTLLFIPHLFVPFPLFLPISSAFCQHYSDASWVMINTITSFNIWSDQIYL